MEFISYVLIVLLVIAILQRLLPAKGIRHISTKALKEELNDPNKQFIDVRTPGEFKGRNIKGFINIPLQQLHAKAGKVLLKEKEVVVICQSGMRSQTASKTLKKLGFLNVTNVKGGMSAWGS